MMSELRWALLILGILFIVALTFWERRRPRQASGALERMPMREGPLREAPLREAPLREAGAESAAARVREPPLGLPEVRVREPVGAAELPLIETHEVQAVPVLEPASECRAHDFDAAADDGAHSTAAPPEPYAARDDEDTVDDIPALVLGEEIDASGAAEAAPEAAAVQEQPAELPAGTPLVVHWPAEHERRVLALRLVAPQRERFAGRSLRQALAAEGFLLGQFAIFHKPDEERRAVLSAASLTRPGTFDLDTMDSQHYGGLSLFAVLPGPKPPRQAFDELVFAARNLNERLHGVLQDEQGTPLTPARIEQLRAELRAGAGS